MAPGTAARRWRRWLVVGVAAIAVLVVGGPFVYIHFIQGKAEGRLALPATVPAAPADATTAGAAAAGGGSLAGKWVVRSGSQVGYRVKEVLFGQQHEAVGRTSSVSGSMTIAGATITAATFTADLTSVTSDEGRRDNQFQGRIMDTSSYPTATFVLSAPIKFASVPANGATVTAHASGKLTLRGTTRDVTLDVTGRRSGSLIQASGSIPITFAGWGIPNPSFGPVTTEDHGLLEFLLAFAHA